MSTNNYFRSKAGYFTFDETHEESVRRAWTYAALNGPVSVFRPFRLRGPWTGSDVIGLTSPTLLRARLNTLPIGSEHALVVQSQLVEADAELSIAWQQHTNRIAA